MCRFKCPLRAKHNPHKSHLKGFSPIWIIMWLVKFLLVLIKNKNSSYHRIRTQKVQDSKRAFYALSYRGPRLQQSKINVAITSCKHWKSILTIHVQRKHLVGVLVWRNTKTIFPIVTVSCWVGPVSELFGALIQPSLKCFYCAQSLESQSSGRSTTVQWMRVVP